MISFLRNLFFKDGWLKLFSLALATLIWFTVSFAIRNEVSPIASLTLNTEKYTVPVVVLSSAADVHDFKVAPKEVEVTVQGDLRALRNLKSQDIRAIVDLTGIEAVGNLQKRIEVFTPPGVTHVRIMPEQVRVLFPPTAKP